MSTPEIIQPRRNTAAGAAANNRVLYMGERGYETDTKRWKTGDGATNWNDLDYDDEPEKIAGSTAEGRAVLTGDAAAGRTALGAASQRIMRPNGPRLGVLGDSLHSYGYSSISGSGVAARLPVIFRQVEWLTHGRVKMTNPQQDPGDTMADVLSTQLPALLAATPLPNACVVAISRNDAGGSFDLDDYLADYTDIAGELFSAGVCPIFLTPMPTGAAGSPLSPQDANMRRLGDGLRKLGAVLGVPVFDQYDALADETGGLKAAVNQGDNTHLTAAGYKAVADWLIAQGFADLFPGVGSSTIKDTANTYDLVGGAGLMKDASPSGFSVAGTGTSVTYVSPEAVDGIAGRWAKVLKASGSTADGAFRWTSGTVVTPGNVYRISGTLKMDGTWDVEAGTYIQVSAEWRNASTTIQTDVLMNRWDRLDRATISEDFTAPSGVDGLRLVAYLKGTATTDQNVYLGEVSVRDLTSMGL